MATAGIEKTPNEIISVVADFTNALATGDSLITGNTTVTVKNAITDVDVTATAFVSGSKTVSGAQVACKIQAGTNGDIWTVNISTGLTTLSYKFELEQNVQITGTPLVSNLLCDIDEVKLELGITDTSEDVRLFTLIAEASDYMRYRCQRDFIFQEYTETLQPDEDYYAKMLRLRNFPVYNVSAVTLRQVNSGDDPFDTVKAAGTWGFNRIGYVWLLDDVWMQWPHVNLITYRAGFPVIPKNLQKAVKGISVWFYRIAGREGLASEKIGSYAYTRAKLTDFPVNMKFELPDEFIEGVISRYMRRDIADQD